MRIIVVNPCGRSHSDKSKIIVIHLAIVNLHRNLPIRAMMMHIGDKAIVVEIVITIANDIDMRSKYLIVAVFTVKILCLT